MFFLLSTLGGFVFLGVPVAGAIGNSVLKVECFNLCVGVLVNFIHSVFSLSYVVVSALAVINHPLHKSVYLVGVAVFQHIGCILFGAVG